MTTLLVSAAAPCTPATDSLVAALRAELQEFGGLLRLLNEEQDQILGDPTISPSIALSIERQLAKAGEAVRVRRDRMILSGGVATEEEIVVAAPVEMRPLVSALFSEVKSLSSRVDVFVTQNEWLRVRAAQFPELNARRASLDA